MLERKKVLPAFLQATASTKQMTNKSNSFEREPQEMQTVKVTSQVSTFT